MNNLLYFMRDYSESCILNSLLLFVLKMFFERWSSIAVQVGRSMRGWQSKQSDNMEKWEYSNERGREEERKNKQKKERKRIGTGQATSNIQKIFCHYWVLFFSIFLPNFSICCYYFRHSLPLVSPFHFSICIYTNIQNI